MCCNDLKHGTKNTWPKQPINHHHPLHLAALYPTTSSCIISLWPAPLTMPLSLVLPLTAPLSLSLPLTMLSSPFLTLTPLSPFLTLTMPLLPFLPLTMRLLELWPLSILLLPFFPTPYLPQHDSNDATKHTKTRWTSLNNSLGHCNVFASSQGPLGLNLESHSLQGRTIGNIFHVFFSWRCRTCSLQCRHPWLQEQTGPTQVHIALTHFNTGEHLITFSKISKLDLCNYSLRFSLLNQTKPPCPGQHWQLKSRKGVNDWHGRISTTTAHHQSILEKNGKISKHCRRCIVQRWRLNIEQVSHSRHVLISHLESN